MLVGTDKFGNKFYENDEELPRTASLPPPNPTVLTPPPVRTRWVDYSKHDFDAYAPPQPLFPLQPKLTDV